MKKIYNLFLAFLIATITSCTYEFPDPEVQTAGSADFSKVVAVGNSLTAGYMNGALYTAGQVDSYANIIAIQMMDLGGGDFNQPDIDAIDGFFGLAPDGTTPLGRLHYVNPLNPAPAPIVPGQFISPSYAGDKTTLNNFGIPGMRITHADFPGYGDPGAGNPYFARFASSPTTTVLSDVTAANGTFFLFWLGNNDVLGYAVAGATGSTDGAGSTDMTPTAVFTADYNAAIAAMTANGAKGIIANIPNVQDIPHFTTVPWDAIAFDTSDPVDDATVQALNANYAVYNGGLDLMVGAGIGFTQEEADFRKIVFANGANGIVITDNTLTDLTGYNPGLVNMRMANSDDLITLTAGAVLGTLADTSNPQSVIGVAVPLGEQYTLILADQNVIATRIADFNATIKAAADGSGGDIALLDMNAIFLDFANSGAEINGSGINASIIPPAGGFSLDGVHPNSRGAAWMASMFIDKINEFFGATIKNINPNDYAGNELPVP